MAGLHLAGPQDGPGIPQMELRDVKSLLPYANNARTHNAVQVTSIANSLREWGWTNPLLVTPDGGIVAGHGRVLGASEIYKTGGSIRFANGALIPPGKVPVLVCDGWTDQQKKAYILADNQLAMLAGWDVALLKVEVDELEDGGFDLELAGFSDDVLAEMFAGLDMPPEEGGGDPDDAPALPAVPASQPGDVWVCGPHRVMCGSSLVLDDWDRLMAGEMADVCWTDPPYNVDVEDKHRQLYNKINPGTREGKAARGIKNDNMGDVEFSKFLHDAFAALITVLKAGAPIYVAHADLEAVNFRSAFKAAGFKLSSNLVWRKNIHVLSRADFMWQHEPILYGWKPGSAHRWYGGRKNTTIIDLGDGSPFTRMEDGRWQIKVGDSVMVVSGDATVEEHPSSIIYEPKPAKSGLHPTQKPVALVERLLRQSARSGDIVVDAFGGSGSTLVAADRLGMCARLMELDPAFVDVIVARWQQLTGRRAVHAVTGELFPAEGEPRAAPPAPTTNQDTTDVF